MNISLTRLKTSIKKYTRSLWKDAWKVVNFFFLSPRLPVLQLQLSCNISWWLRSVGCWWRDFTSTSLWWKFTTSPKRCTCITSCHGVFSFYLFWIVWLHDHLNRLALISYLCLGLPIVMVGISLCIAAGKDGIESFTSDK